MTTKPEEDKQTKPTELLSPKTRSVKGIHFEENV
jgi:hypothetical protein